MEQEKTNSEQDIEHAAAVEAEHKRLRELVENASIKKQTSFSVLSPSILADLFALVEVKEMRVEKIYMNAFTFAGLHKLADDVIKAESDHSKLKNGLLAHVWGAEIHVTKAIDSGVVLAVSEAYKGTLICATMELGKGSDEAKALVKLLCDLDEARATIRQGFSVMTKIANELLKRLEIVNGTKRQG